MNGATHTYNYTIYPKRYFDDAPTWNAWNKLSVADVYALTQERNYAGQNVWFWLNHPIQFIRLVGVVVQIDLVAGGKICLLTLDDCSGANIELRVVIKEHQTAKLELSSSNTDVDNLDVCVVLGTPVVLVNKQRIGLGSIIRAQGRLKCWRQDRQLELKRIFNVRDTNEEALHWENAARWKHDVLSQPWILSQQQRDAADDRIRQQDARDKAKAKMKHERQMKHEQQMVARQAKREAKRQIEEKQMSTGALKGSEILHRPWEA